jgi:hypothetical protein
MAKTRLSTLARLRVLHARDRFFARPTEETPLRRPQEVPAAMAGKYVAWSSDGLVILGAGDTVEEARGHAAGHPHPIIEWIPPAEELRAVPVPASD